jgi:hypothetical protein
MRVDHVASTIVIPCAFEAGNVIDTHEHAGDFKEP